MQPRRALCILGHGSQHETLSSALMPMQAPLRAGIYISVFLDRLLGVNEQVEKHPCCSTFLARSPLLSIASAQEPSTVRQMWDQPSKVAKPFWPALYAGLPLRRGAVHLRDVGRPAGRRDLVLEQHRHQLRRPLPQRLVRLLCAFSFRLLPRPARSSPSCDACWSRGPAACAAMHAAMANRPRTVFGDAL